MRLTPILSARSRALPWRVISGGPPRLRVTSIDFQGMPRTPVPRAFITASFAANLLANWGARLRAYLRSSVVKTLLRNRTGVPVANSSDARDFDEIDAGVYHFSGTRTGPLVDAMVLNRAHS